MSDDADVIDPTRNVLDLVAASTRRLDDLRIAAERLSSVQHEHLKEVGEIRSDYEDKLRLAEAGRLDAIRAVDVAAATLREERASAAASVLANQVAITASTLRDLVASTATAAATAAAAVTNPLADRISQLERSSYEGTGKSAVADPLLAEMAQTIKALSTNMAQGQGGKDSRSDSRSNVGMIVGIIGSVFAFLVLVLAVVTFVASRSSPAAPTETGASSPRVVIPLPPAQLDRTPPS